MKEGEEENPKDEYEHDSSDEEVRRECVFLVLGSLMFLMFLHRPLLKCSSGLSIML